jgi:hypothetical protein
MTFVSEPYPRTTEAIMMVPRVERLRLERWRSFLAALFNPYRPELHYMRGPGPKWRAKHGGKRAS